MLSRQMNAIVDLYGFVGLAEGICEGVQIRLKIGPLATKDIASAKKSLKILQNHFMAQDKIKEASNGVADLPNIWP